jgi:hypothetical protein
MSSCDGRNLQEFGMPFCVCISEFESATYGLYNSFLMTRTLCLNIFFNDILQFANSSFNSSNCKICISEGHFCRLEKQECNMYKTEFGEAFHEFEVVDLQIDVLVKLF